MLLDFIRGKRSPKSADYYLNESKTFCVMPFVHLHVTQNGNVTPCCQAPWGEEAALGNVNEASVEEIWNGKKFNKFRKTLSLGKGHPSCERCYEKEEFGWISLREITNNKYTSLIERLASNNFAPTDYKRPVYFDIRFSNVCNLKCRICSFASSSSWHEDEIKLGNIPEGTPVLTKSILDEEKFYREFDAHAEDIQEMYFAGGEPIMMKQHFEVLDFLIAKGNTSCKLYYNTNLSRLKLKDYDVLEYWKKFDFVNLAVSLDDIGERLEYQRKNSSWKEIEKNMKIIQNECPNVRLMISPTISIFNILHITEMHQTLHENGLVRPEDVIPTMLSYPREFNIRILEEGMKTKISETLKAHVNWLKGFEPEDSEMMSHCINQFLNLIQYLKGAELLDARANLAAKINEVDEIRGEKFEEIYPELAHLIG